MIKKFFVQNSLNYKYVMSIGTSNSSLILNLELWFLNLSLDAIVIVYLWIKSFKKILFCKQSQMLLIEEKPYKNLL